MATARPNRTRRIRRNELEQFRQSLESWERQGQEAGRDGDVELAAGYTEDVADLRAILRLIETGALHEAAEAIDCLDTLIRDHIPQPLYERWYRGVDALDTIARRSTRSLSLQIGDIPRLEGGLDSGTVRRGGPG